MSSELDTIFALSSGARRSGVAVVRVSGPRAADSVRTLAGLLPEPRRAILTGFTDPRTGELIDRGLAIWFPAPKSFTGEDVVEFQLHGGRAIVAAVLDLLGGLEGYRLAEAGEFTRRAFDNGKLDLTAAEGLADLINAETEGQRRQALRQSEGALNELYDGWRARLIYVLAMTEAALDFSDEGDVPSEVAAQVRPDVEALAGQISQHLQDGHRGEILRDGFRVVLAGPTNAGKSSLLNALARRDAAIVSDEAGTTRDVIEVRLDLGGLPVIVTDTAGFRETDGAIEKEGIKRSIGEARKADLVLWLRAPEQMGEPFPEDLLSVKHKVIPVLNKSDLLSGERVSSDVDLVISVSNGSGLQELTERLTDEAANKIGSLENPAISNARQRQELEGCLTGLKAFLSGPQNEIELRAEDLRQAVQALGRITGKVDVEDVLDKVFSAFCIGK